MTDHPLPGRRLVRKIAPTAEKATEPQKASVQPQRPLEPPKGRRPANQVQPMPPRLPHGALFTLMWNAETMKWSGALTVTVNGKAETFQDRAKAVFTLFSKLDTHFRKWLKSHNPK